MNQEYFKMEEEVDERIEFRLDQEPELKFENVVGALRGLAILYLYDDNKARPGLTQLAIDAVALMKDMKEDLDWYVAQRKKDFNRDVTKDDNWNGYK